MKLWSRGLCIVSAIGLSACSSIQFDHSMPMSTEPLKGFAPEMQATYQWTDSVFNNKTETFYNDLYYGVFPSRDSFNIISAHIVIKEKLSYDFIRIRSYYKMAGADTARLSKKHDPSVSYVKGGYVIYEEISNDTLLDLAKKDELKLYEEAYYLNRRLGDDTDEADDNHDWDILQLVMKNKDEFFINIANEKDKRKLRRFMITSKNDLFPTVRLSDKRFYRFVKKGGFRDSFQFKRIADTTNIPD